MRVLLVGEVIDAQIVDALPDAVVGRDVDEPDAVVSLWDGNCTFIGGLPTIAIVSTCDETAIVAAMHAGARDVVSVERLDRLAAAIAAAMRTESQTRISEARFQSLWDSDILLLTIIGPNGRILEANRGFLRVLGYTLDELRSYSWADLTPPQWEATDAIARQQLLAGAAKPWRKGVWAKDGRHVPLLASAVLLPGSPPQALAFAIDLTEQQRVDDALLERARLAAAIAEVALAATEETTVEALLARAARAIGGQVAFRLADGTQLGDWTGTTTRFPLAVGDEQLGLLALRSRLDDASFQDLSTLANQIALGIRRVRDARATEELAAQLQQAQKLEAIGTLAGGVAHDFNNLLSVIIGYAEMLREATTGDCLSDVQEILAAADRAKALTAQLLAFGRRQVLQPRVLRLDELVARVLPMLRRLMPANIEIVTRLAPATVRADPNQLEQVVMNLVINARDAIAMAGKITIAVTPGVTLSVSDSGCGMDAATQARAFEPFFTTKAAGKGTGLGLAMVFGIIKQTGGSIDVASAVGRGTTIAITLPAAEAVPVAPVAPRTSTKKLNGTETILTCEDEPQLRTLVHAVLTRHGYRVLSARNGEEAISFASTPVDLLVTDVIMPGMSGRELAEKLRARDPQLKVIYMSGYTDDLLIHEGVSEASVAFLQKPIHPDDLARKVRDVLDEVQG